MSAQEQENNAKDVDWRTPPCCADGAVEQNQNELAADCFLLLFWTVTAGFFPMARTVCVGPAMAGSEIVVAAGEWDLQRSAVGC